MRINRLSTRTTTGFESLNAMGTSLAAMFQPPERISVADAAEKYVHLNIPGAYMGPYQNRLTPYMVEPMNVLGSRDYRGCVFAGPAQSGKTQSLILNWLAYTVRVDPMDMIIYNPSHATARDFAVRRVDRLHRHSPEIGKMLSPRADDDNRHDKMYRNGTMLTLSWPSVSEFAGKPVGRVALTDFDRMDDDIDGDGNPYDLASKRTTTFGSFAMTLAESSPSRPLEDPRWIARSAHEAPPVTGILGLYNRGDRRRWYWPCSRCNDWFEGNFKHLRWADVPDRMEAAESVRLVCPKCEHPMKPENRRDLQEWGTWLRDGQAISASGKITGKATRSEIASFWLNGVAATFITWPQLVAAYLTAEEEFRKTGSEDSLRKFFNNDLAEPYLTKNKETIRTPESLRDRAEKWTERTVPSSVRFLVAAVDVQTNLFVVQIFGIAPGEPFDVYLVDRFDIRKSKRVDADGDRAWVKPGTYVEDWNLLIEEVIQKTYLIDDDSGSRMQVRMTLCDSGGRAGVTTNAYNFYRVLRRNGMSDRFHLVKGEPQINAPRVRVGYPDSQTRATGTKAGAQGDVPVLFINSTINKDALNSRLDATETGRGKFHFPSWLEDWFFAEMCSEVRTPKGWEVGRGGRQRNEAWDLSYYLLGFCASTILNVERIDWTGKVPPWADIADRNPYVSGRKKEDVAPEAKPGYKMRNYGSVLG